MLFTALLLAANVQFEGLDVAFDADKPPVPAQVAPGEKGMFFEDGKGGVTVLALRTGDGRFTRPPLPMDQLVTGVAASQELKPLGSARVVSPRLAVIAGERSDGKAQAIALFTRGHFWSFIVSGSSEERVAKAAKRIEKGFAKLAAEPLPANPGFAPVGLLIPSLVKAPVDITKPIEGVVVAGTLYDPENRRALVVRRVAFEAAWRDRAEAQKRLSSEMRGVKDAGDATVAGMKGFAFTYPRGKTSSMALFVVEDGKHAWIIQAGPFEGDENKVREQALAVLDGATKK